MSLPSYPTPIVSASWLHDHLDDPAVVVADCRFSLMEPELGRSQYEAGHIPGAVYFDLNRDLAGPVQQHGGRHPLPDLPPMVATLERAGIHSGNGSPPSFVVVYDDSRFAFASRLWWMLRYLGHDRVAVLDGGFASWRRAGYLVSQEIPRPQVGYFVPQVRSHWLVDREAVKARKDQPLVALVDAREGDRYRGEREPIDPIAGHIPGAVNYFWQEATDETGMALSPEAHQARWATLREAEEIMVYCGSGVTACVNLLSLAIAGMETGKLYAGSWSDWCSYS
ncbi:MAG: sulfurtransferase [Synechococcales bacterium]|nr:sulfurtransferase [Synechococcales bacterium]